MPHFIVNCDQDGEIEWVLKDGLPHNEEVNLEQLFSIPSTYFKIATFNIEQMERVEEKVERRCFGLQSFLMSLTAIEAFTNTYFHLRGWELPDEAILKRVRETRGSISRKITELVALSPDGQLND